MILADLIKDRNGHIPDVTTALHDWTQWVALNADASLIPTEARFFRDYPEDKRDWYSEPVTAAGRAKEMDWGREPDWYWWYRHWRGFLPQRDFETPLDDPWWMKIDEPIPFNASSDNQRFSITRTAADKFNDDFAKVDELVLNISDLHPFQDGREGIPPPFAIREVTDVPYDSLETLQRQGAAIKRAVLDRVGWLRWWRAVTNLEDLQNQLTHSSFKQFLYFTEPRYKSRGYIFNLTRDWTEINISLLLDQNVPIHYTWGFEERGEPRLSKLHPKVIALNESDGRVILDDEEEADETRIAAEQTKFYDDYFQTRDLSNDDQHLSFGSDAIFYIIDFEGWRRRRLPDEIDSSNYAARFQFSVAQKDNGSVPIVTFRRWKRKPIPLVERTDTTWTQGLDFSEERTLREIYKFGYAPHGKTYDIVTGLPDE